MKNVFTSLNQDLFLLSLLRDIYIHIPYCPQVIK